MGRVYVLEVMIECHFVRDGSRKIKIIRVKNLSIEACPLIITSNMTVLASPCADV